jgi:hypothetical protein
MGLLAYGYLNIVSTLLLFAFYFPPSFKMKHRNESRLQIVKNIDYVGISISQQV